MGDGWWVFNTLVHRGLSIHEKALVSCLLLDVTMQEVLRQSDFPKDERDSARNSAIRLKQSCCVPLTESQTT